MNKLDFPWAHKRWQDTDTKTEVVCLSPDRKTHFQNNYFNINMVTGDGKYIVFCEFDKIENGIGCGNKRLWARDTKTGRMIDLGPLSPTKWVCTQWSVARHSHRVNVVDSTNPDSVEIIQIDIETAKRRRIVPKQKLNYIYDVQFSADEKYIYMPWWKEKGHLVNTMEQPDFLGMMAAQPGYQEMIRIDLANGDIKKIFSTDKWYMGHPNPHPSFENILMCCQEWAFESEKWGLALEHERVRVFDLSSQQGNPNISKFVLLYSPGLFEANIIYYDNWIVQSPIGVEELESASVAVWPNPTNGQLSFKAPANQNIEAVSVFDINGRTVKAEPINLIQGEIDLSDLNPGFYTVAFNLNNGSRITEKVIVK